MSISDAIYGPLSYVPPIIQELLLCPSVLRLKKISQLGVPEKYYFIPSYSRYEHSLGVYILLSKLQANQTEQIAGLLHDISHTAFSHVADFVFGSSQTHTFQDENHKNRILQSEIPEILNKYNISTEEIIHAHSFKLLDQPIPELCVDRLDYALREFSLSDAKKIIKDILVKNGTIVCSNEETALLLAELFLERFYSSWGSEESILRYTLFADILSRAIKIKLISIDDLWLTDDIVLKKIEKTKDADILKICEVLSKTSLRLLPKSNIIVKTKLRYVDPYFLNNGEKIRLSSVNDSLKTKIQQAREYIEKGVKLPLI